MRVAHGIERQPKAGLVLRGRRILLVVLAASSRPCCVSRAREIVDIVAWSARVMPMSADCRAGRAAVQLNTIGQSAFPTAAYIITAAVHIHSSHRHAH